MSRVRGGREFIYYHFSFYDLLTFQDCYDFVSWCGIRFLGQGKGYVCSCLREKGVGVSMGVIVVDSPGWPPTMRCVK